MAALQGGGRGCGKLVRSPKNVPLRLREVGFRPSCCQLRKSLGVVEVFGGEAAARAGVGLGGRPGSVLGKHSCLEQAPRRGGDVLPSSLETKV